MRVISDKDNIKIHLLDDGEELYMGSIPLHWIIHYLRKVVEYSLPKSIRFMKDVYDLDLSQVIDNEYTSWSESDIYDDYRRIKPFERKHEDKRKEFSNRYRNYFLNFDKSVRNSKGKDFISDMNKAVDVHHIFPLVFGGENELENLIYINDFHHELLHLNPREDEYKYCHQALVYLWYLNHPYAPEKNSYLGMLYDLKIFKNVKAYSAQHYYKYMISNEMMKFYDEINT